ncbi:MAG: hypothetical protein AABX66_01340 [Nanoarchaeota archaeon]
MSEEELYRRLEGEMADEDRGQKVELEVDVAGGDRIYGRLVSLSEFVLGLRDGKRVIEVDLREMRGYRREPVVL